MRPTSGTLRALAQVLSLGPACSLGDFHWPIDATFSSLSSTLSGDAEIFFPGSEGFVNGTLSLVAKKPQLDALVRVATEEDVRNTVFESVLKCATVDVQYH